MIPVCVAYWPIERARWLVAAADNALAKSNDDDDQWIQQAQALLEQAKNSYSGIENTLEFARTSFRMDPEETDRAIKLVLSTGPSRQIHAANVLAELRLESADFDSAYQILVAGYPSPASRSAIERNQLAYYAALANRDLEIALSDIEKALVEMKNASFLDTKAWILFRLKRYDEALVAIDQSIKELKLEVKETVFPSPMRAKIQDLHDGKEPFVKRPLAELSNPLASFNREFSQIIKSIVVIHYHRGEILEALEKTAEADEEYSWLQDRGFHDFERLY